jgi:glyoxylase I family protein
MPRGTINHIALTAKDLQTSATFYDKILGFFGYTRVPVPATTQEQMKTELLAWSGPGSSITLRAAKLPYQDIPHNRDAPGLNHLAFAAASRDEVDRCYQLVQEIGATLLDAPAEYTYFPGYYAVYFLDPSRIKIEVVHWPAL